MGVQLKNASHSTAQKHAKADPDPSPHLGGHAWASGFHEGRLLSRTAEPNARIDPALRAAVCVLGEAGGCLISHPKIRSFSWAVCVEDQPSTTKQRHVIDHKMCLLLCS